MNRKKFQSVFVESPNKEKINYTLAALTPRKIDNGNSIKYKNKYYQPYLNNELKCFCPKTECLVIKSFNGNLFVAIDEQVMELKELNRNEKISKEFNEKEVTKSNPQKYVPSMQHPWKVSEFRKQQRRAKLQHLYA